MINELNYKINGEKISGKLYLPEKKDKQLIIIISHGLSLDYSYTSAYAQRLYDKNIASYIYDFRGGGFNSRSDGKICDMTIDSEMDDLNQVIDSLKEEEFVDENKIYLAGHSQGGLVSSLVAAKRDDIQGLFLFAPAYEIPYDVQEEPRSEMNVLNLMPDDLGEKYINSASKINLFDDVKDFIKPVYIFHGMEDKRVPIEYSVMADKEYENSTVYIYEEGEHRFSEEINDDVVNIIYGKLTENEFSD